MSGQKVTFTGTMTARHEFDRKPTGEVLFTIVVQCEKSEKEDPHPVFLVDMARNVCIQLMHGMGVDPNQGGLKSTSTLKTPSGEKIN